MRKRTLSLVVASLLVMGLTACSGNSDESTDTGDTQTQDDAAGTTEDDQSGSDTGDGGAGGDALIKVGFSQLGAESGWRTANTESVKASLTPENGFDLTFVDAQQKQENQIKALRDFIDQGVDIIAFSPVIETGWDEVLQEIKDAGIPVLLVDRTVDTTVEDPFVAWIGGDFTLEGTMAGDWVKANHPDAKIFELQGTMGSGAQVNREEGFDAVVGEQIIGKASGNFTRAEGKAAMEAALQAYPDMTLLFAHNDDMGLGAVEAIEAAGKVPGEDILIVTVDGVRDGMQALVDKKFNYIVECNPVFGEQIGELLKKIVAGEEVPPTTIVVDETFDQSTTQELVDARPY